MPDSAPKRLRSAMLEDLKGTFLFKGVADDAIYTLIPHSSLCKVEQNKKLSPARKKDGVYLYIIRTGYFAIRVDSELLNLTESNFLGWRGPGQVLGEMRIVSSEPAEAQMKATEPCELIELKASVFEDVAKSNALIYRNLASLLVRKMLQERKRSEVIQMTPARRQVAQSLLNLVEERGYESRASMVIKGRILQADLAGYIGVRRETVTQCLRELAREHIISYGEEGGLEEGKFRILNQDDLNDQTNLP